MKTRREIEGAILLGAFMLVAVIVMSQVLTLMDYVFGA